MQKEKSPWKIGIFYFNPQDKRIFPPKRFPGIGWTINFGYWPSILVFVGISIALYFILKMFR